MADITFVIHGDWLDNIKGLPVEQQDKIIADFVRYGVEKEMEHSDDAVISAFVNMVKGNIDYSKNKYEEKKFGGRKAVLDQNQIYNMARNGKNSTEIAAELGISKSSVDHSEGWKHRKEDEFVF